MRLTVRGVEVVKSCLDEARQARLVEVVRDVWRQAPPYAPETPYGKAMSVRMTSAGAFGWYSDRSGYRYVSEHPNGAAWPGIPEEVLGIWREVTGLERLPECCLVNFYGEGARMGMHQDKDEANLDWPVVSISLGDEAMFRVGQVQRGGPTKSIWLKSGDVAVLSGETRLVYHGIDRIKFCSSSLLPDGGRINVTLRVAG